MMKKFKEYIKKEISQSRDFDNAIKAIKSKGNTPVVSLEDAKVALFSQAAWKFIETAGKHYDTVVDNYILLEGESIYEFFENHSEDAEDLREYISELVSALHKLRQVVDLNDIKAATNLREFDMLVSRKFIRYQ